MRNNKYDMQRGFTIVEMLVSVALTSVLMAAGFASINLVAKSINRSTLSKILIETKANLVDSSLNPTALAYSISDATNQSMNCLRDQTDCSASPGGAFKLHDKKNEIVYNSISPTSGFGTNGEVCDGFDEVNPSALCPFRYDLTWTPICPGGGAPCDRPVIRISGVFKGRIPNEASGAGLNAERLSFSIMTSSGTTDLPYVKKEMVYLNRNTTVNIDILSNSWSGTTSGTLTLTDVSAPGHGVASVDASGHLVYTPTTNYSGLDSAVITVHSDHGEKSTSVVWFKVMTPFTWTGDANDSKWATARNWCGSANAAHTGCVGSAAAPTSSDFAIFDGTCAGTCNPTSTIAAVKIKGMTMNNDFIGTLSVQSGSFTVGSDGFLQLGGAVSFSGGASMRASGDFNLLGGTFTAPSALLYIDKNMTIGAGGNFIANAGTVQVTTGASTQTISANNVAFYGFDFANGNDGGAINFAGGTVKIEGLLNGHPWKNHYCPHFDNGTLQAKGNVTLSDCGLTGSGIIVLKGNPAGQVVNAGTDGRVSHLRVEAGTYPVKIVGNLHITGNLYDDSDYTYVSSGPYTLTGTTFTYSGNSLVSIRPGNINYNNVYIALWNDGAVLDLNATTMKIKGKLTLASTVNHYCPKATNGTLEAHGDVEINECGMPGSMVVKIAGNPAGQTINGISGAVSNLKIETQNNPASFMGKILIQPEPWGPAGSFTYVDGSGPIAWNSSELIFSGQTSVTPGSGVFGNVTFQPTNDGGFNDLNGGTMKVHGVAKFATIPNHYCGAIKNGTVEAQGDILVDSGPNCSTDGLIVKLSSGTATHDITTNYGHIGNLIIDAATDPVTIHGVLNMAGSNSDGQFTYVNSGGVTWAPGSALSIGGATKISVVPGNIDYTSVGFSPFYTGRVDLNGKVMKVKGPLSLQSDACNAINNGSLTAYKGVVTFAIGKDSCFLGSVGLTFAGPDSITYSVVGTRGVSGHFVVDKTGSASVKMLSTLDLGSPGQTLKVKSGKLDGSCHGISVNAAAAIDAGAELHDSGQFTYGVLQQNGVLDGCTTNSGAPGPTPVPTPAPTPTPAPAPTPTPTPSPTPIPAYPPTACQVSIQSKTVDMTATDDMHINNESSTVNITTPIHSLSLNSISANTTIASAMQVTNIKDISGNLWLNANTIGNIKGVSGTMCISTSNVTSLDGGSGATEIFADTIGNITSQSGALRIHRATITKLTKTSGNICLLDGAHILDTSDISGTVTYDCN